MRCVFQRAWVCVVETGLGFTNLSWERAGVLVIHSFVPKPACELPVALLGTNLRSLGREGQVGPTQGSAHGLPVAAASPLNPRAALLVPMSFLVGFFFFFNEF